MDPEARPVGTLEATKDAPVGGQAVLEGVMMRGVTSWAVAVRKPEEEVREKPEDERTDLELDSGEVEVEIFNIEPWTKKHRLLRLPVIRGVVALGETMKIGFQALGISANAQLPDEEEKISNGAWVGTIILSLALGIGLFCIVPVGLTSLIKDQLDSSILFWLVEGVLRTLIFLLYLWGISKLPDLRRVFEYHGAEHKAIACYEANDELVPERAAQYTRFHPRCGTSFLLIVMVVAIFVFAPLGLPAWYWLVLSRIVGVPLIAGLSFEVIKWAGRNRTKPWVKPVIWPGMQLQRLTTREPDLAQLAVAIAALKAVLERDDSANLTADDLIGVEVAA